MKFQKYFDKKQRRFCWRFDFTLAGRRLRRGGFLTKTDAESFAATIRVQSQRRTYGLPIDLPDHSLNDLLREMKADPQKKPRRILAVRTLAKVVGGNRLLTNLTRIDLQHFLTHLQARNCRPGTIRSYLADLRTVLGNLDRYYPIYESWRPPKFPKAPARVIRTRILTQAELSKLFKVMLLRAPKESAATVARRRSLFDIARLMLLTGARREEICKITPARIHWEQKLITLISSKSGREHQIAVGDLALEILRERARLIPKGPLYTDLKNYQVTEMLQRDVLRAGIAYGQREPGGWSLHDFRRTAATLIEDAGIPYSAVMEQLGHKRRDVTATYTVPQLDTLRRAAQILEAWCRDIDGFKTSQLAA